MGSAGTRPASKPGKNRFPLFAGIAVATLVNLTLLLLWIEQDAEPVAVPPSAALEGVSGILESEPAETPAESDKSDAGEIATELLNSIASASQKIIDIAADLPLPGSGNESSEIAGVAQLLIWGRGSEDEARLFEPLRNNALYYYERVLKIDRANTAAQNGRTRVLSALEAKVSSELDNKQYLQAEEILTRFRYSHPKHSANRRLLAIVTAGLERELAPIRANPKSDIGAAIALLSTMGSAYSSAQESLLLLKNERQILAKLDRAITDGFLLPPDRRNVYEQILQLREDRSVSADKLDERALEVSRQLYGRAETFIANKDLASARIVVAAMKILAVDQEGIRQLNLKLDQSGNSPITDAAGDTHAEGPITEARVLHRVEALYPLEARDQRIEGWVRLSFLIDETGQLRDLSVVGEEPAGVFTDASIAAVYKWQFQPAQDRITGANIVASFSIKLDFTLPP